MYINPSPVTQFFSSNLFFSAISIGYLVAGQTKFGNVKSHPAKSGKYLLLLC